MEGPIRVGTTWWQHDGNDWYEWNSNTWERKDDFPFPPPPKRRSAGSEPFWIYLSGVVAALVSLGIALAFAGDSAAAVLAPVLGVIGAFTGHAAGHSSAVRAVREGKSG